MDKLAKNIPTLEERGLPDHSYFVLGYKDGSMMTERAVLWSEISEPMRVKYFGVTKLVYVCNDEGLEWIEMRHDGLSKELKIPHADFKVYQAVRSVTDFSNGKSVSKVVGRTLGFVRYGEVVEEYFLNGPEHTVQGMKK